VLNKWVRGDGEKQVTTVYYGATCGATFPYNNSKNQRSSMPRVHAIVDAAGMFPPVETLNNPYTLLRKKSSSPLTPFSEIASFLTKIRQM
jgi:hypothetical protein